MSSKIRIYWTVYFHAYFANNMSTKVNFSALKVEYSALLVGYNVQIVAKFVDKNGIALE